jgi:hypothetical protein
MCCSVLSLEKEKAPTYLRSLSFLDFQQRFPLLGLFCFYRAKSSLTESELYPLDFVYRWVCLDDIDKTEAILWYVIPIQS